KYHRSSSRRKLHMPISLSQRRARLASASIMLGRRMAWKMKRRTILLLDWASSMRMMLEMTQHGIMEKREGVGAPRNVSEKGRRGRTRGRALTSLDAGGIQGWGVMEVMRKGKVM